MFRKFIIMSFVVALTGSCLAFSRRQPRVSFNVARMMSIRGGSLPANEDDRVPYALGVNIARQVGGELKGVLTKEELALMIQGFGDSIQDHVVDDKALLMTYGPKINEMLNARAHVVTDKERKKGLLYVTKYLTENPTAINTESGLVYHELVPGIGKQATVESTVQVHYHGTLVDGTVFDSSVERGEPIKFPLANVIQGWKEGVSMMKEGGKARLICPAEIAYGDSGAPPHIAAGATIVFDVELISVLKE